MCEDRAPSVRSNQIEPFEIFGRRVANITEAALSKERLKLAGIDPKLKLLTDRLHDPAFCLHRSAARMLCRCEREVVEDNRAAWPGALGDKVERSVYACRSQIHSHALPDKQRPGLLSIAA